MKFLLVDDEVLSLKYLERILRRLYPNVDLVSADNYKDALELMDESVLVAFLDIEMPGMTGIELAKNLLTRNPKLNIIFVTAYDNYAREAYRVHASGYLTKPYDSAEILREMEHLRYEIPLTKAKLRVQCFGHFEVFSGEQPIHFERKGAKEILAYLVDLRGASCSRLDVCTAMWEDSDEVERRKTYFRTLIFSLRNTLKQYDAEDIFINHRDSYAINMELLDCDYYRYLSGDKNRKVQFRGEYMSQYRWAEARRRQLEESRKEE